MFEKYISIKESKIISGQDGKTGIWYCKELPTDSVKETKEKIGELNKIYNEYNAATKKKRLEEKKEPDPVGVTGLS